MAVKPVKANKTVKDGASDKVMTPPSIAKAFIKKLPINDGDVLLDSCRGRGAFYDNFPEGNKKYYCEIDECINFFDFTQNVDWIISNPPYSIYDRFIEHCFELSNNVCLLVPFSKIATSLSRIKAIVDYGAIMKIWFISAGRCGFPFGFPCGFIWIRKNEKENNWELVEIEKAVK